MKKLLIYSATAAVIGLILTLLPVLLVALTELEAEKDYAAARSAFTEGLEKLEGTYTTLDKPKYSIADLGVIALSFIIALSAYIFLRPKMPH